ncbi:PucR family transcriptional regulator ligand-binding domain-containing protein [Brevibacterium picturae]|uniref:PucR family transcriptional regulator n=1 Tax=Brevibacterium picturae TaxID=260553 RepID=A0ABN2C018_9MICO
MDEQERTQRHGDDTRAADQAVAALTVAELLEVEEISSGGPEIVSGDDLLGRGIRWVHIADSERVERFLEGGELVLTTARTFRESPAAMAEFFDQLERVDASGTIVELVDEASAPDLEAAEVLRRAAAGRNLPVILLSHRIKFVRITELAHRRLLAQQLSQLERAREIHETYTRLSLERAEVQTIVDRTAELLAAPVVLEDVAHRVLAHAGRGSESIIQDWSDLVSAPSADGERRWQQTPVGLRARRWGRLVVPRPTESGIPVDQIIDRAGEALTLTRMADRDEQDLLLQAQSGLVREIADTDDLDEKRARARARSLGFAPPEGAALVPVVVRLDRDPAADPTRLQLRERGLTAELVSAATRQHMGCLSTSLQSGSFGLILALSRNRDETQALERLLTEEVEHSTIWTVGIGRSTTSLLDAVARLDSAAQVAEVASTLEVRERPFYRSGDVRLRGLLSVLSSDSRLRAFAEGELGPLLGSTPADTEMRDFLELFLAHGGNKSAVARAGFLSRPALYARIAKLESSLGVSLADAESRTALHVALLWWRMND